jgi:hypothetical protein
MTDTVSEEEFSSAKAMRDKIAIQISAQHSFGDTAGLSWVTTVPQDITQEDLDGLLSKMREAIYKQRKWMLVERMETDVELAVKQLASYSTNINIIDAKWPSQERAPSDQKTARQQAVDSIVRNQDLIKTYESEIKKVRAQLNGA